MEIRKLHNDCKRRLIVDWVKPRTFVLDCGCGRGGDWWKWKAVQARVAAIDPDEASLKEAEERALTAQFGVWFLGTGDIRQAAFAGPFDIVCYNFSLHYIFETPEIFDLSTRAISASLGPDGLLIGIVPELARVESLVDQFGHFKDELGNEIALLQGGRRLLVRLVDGPFYAEGGREEPTLDAQILRDKLARLGFECLVWEPMLERPNGLVSDMYSKFVFRKSSK